MKTLQKIIDKLTEDLLMMMSVLMLMYLILVAMFESNAFAFEVIKIIALISIVIFTIVELGTGLAYFVTTRQIVYSVKNKSIRIRRR